MEFRSGFGNLNSFILDSLRGLDETIQYQQGGRRRKEMAERSDELGRLQKDLNRLEASQRSVTNLAILVFSFAMLFLMILLKQAGEVSVTGMLVGTIAMMGSFGPVTALASLSNNLNQTLASGERVLSLLEEEPQVEEVSGKNFYGNPEGKDHRHPRGERLREIYASKAPDAVLGCAGRKDQHLRQGRAGYQYRRSAGNGILCDAGDLPVS